MIRPGPGESFSGRTRVDKAYIESVENPGPTLQPGICEIFPVLIIY